MIMIPFGRLTGPRASAGPVRRLGVLRTPVPTTLRCGVAVLALCWAGIGVCQAQRFEGRFDGVRGPGASGGLFGAVVDPRVQEQLELTSRQITQIQELLGQSRDDRDGLQQRLRAAETPAERDALIAEGSREREARKAEAEDQLRQLLAPRQFTLLQEVVQERETRREQMQNLVRVPGSVTGRLAAIGETELQLQLKLTIEQRAALEKILSDLSQGRTAMFEGLRTAKSEAERLQALERFHTARLVATKAADEQIGKLFSPEQLSLVDAKVKPSQPAEAIGGAEKPAAATPSAVTPVADAIPTTGTPAGSRPISQVANQVAQVQRGPTRPSAQKAEDEEDEDEEDEEDEDEESEAASPGVAKPAVTRPAGDSVADFKSSGTAPRSDRGRTRGEKQLSFRFRYAPWEMVLERFAEEAGLTLDMNVVPVGTFNYFDEGSYSPNEALDILNGYLLPKGYLLVRRDRFLVVVSLDEPVPPSLIPRVTVDELPQRGRHELLSVLFPVTAADVASSAQEVEQLLGPLGKVTALAKSNRLLVTDIGANLQRVYDLLIGDAAGDDRFRAFALKHVPAADAAQLVRDLFGLGADGRSRKAENSTAETVQVAIDVRTNSLLVTASPKEMAVISQAIEAVDVEAEGATGSLGGPFRTLSLGGRSSEEILPLLQKVWPQEQRNPIRVVVPSAIGPALRSDFNRSRPSLKEAPDAKEAPSSKEGPDGSESDEDKSGASLDAPRRIDTGALFRIAPQEAGVAGEGPRLRAGTADVFAAVDGDAVDGDAVEGNADAEIDQFEEPAETRPVVIAPSGNQLIIASEYTAALDRLQQLIVLLIRTAPKGPQWTLFYLRMAEAEATARMLSQLLPNSSVLAAPAARRPGEDEESEGGSSLSVSGSTGTPGVIRIIADTRANALFVSGTGAQIQEVEQLLKVLDEPDLPDSMRDRQPRMIPVENVPAAEVATALREVYREELEGSQATNVGGGGGNGGGGRGQGFGGGGPGGGQNPFVQMMVQGQGRAAAPRRAQMTLGVDARTNTLIVSANDALFKQVEDLVATLDQSASDVPTTVRVVPLQNASSAVVQQALNSLVGNVRVSTTGTPRPAQPATNNAAPNTNDGGNQGDFRDFQQRMFERMQNRNSGNGGGRGGGNGGGGRRRGGQ